MAKARLSKITLVWRYAVSALVAVVAAAIVLVIVFIPVSNAPLPELADGFHCVPASQIPQLDIGSSGQMTTTYGHFTATFHASIPAPILKYNGIFSGMPFRGDLTVSVGDKHWTLPRPNNPNGTVINALCVIALQRERHPAVMIEGFSGGAHCCEEPVIYLFNGREDRYVKAVDMSPLNFKDPHAFDYNAGFTPVVAGSRVLLRTGDDVFAYAFDCYACSAIPIVLDSVGPDGLSDVTLQHPSLVAANAATIWKSAQSSTTEFGAGAFGILPAWVADECALGRGATAWAVIERLQRQGKLSNALYAQETYNHGSYVASLKAFLLRNDYCTGEI